jgi:hypothetical protein
MCRAPCALKGRANGAALSSLGAELIEVEIALNRGHMLGYRRPPDIQGSVRRYAEQDDDLVEDLNTALALVCGEEAIPVEVLESPRL